MKGFKSFLSIQSNSPVLIVREYERFDQLRIWKLAPVSPRWCRGAMWRDKPAEPDDNDSDDVDDGDDGDDNDDDWW